MMTVYEKNQNKEMAKMTKRIEAKEVKVLEIITGLAAILLVFIAVPVFIIYLTPDCKTAIAIAYLAISALIVDIGWELYKAIKRRK